MGFLIFVDPSRLRVFRGKTVEENKDYHFKRDIQGMIMMVIGFF
jgi:hypothetical protein